MTFLRGHSSRSQAALSRFKLPPAVEGLQSPQINTRASCLILLLSSKRTQAREKYQHELSKTDIEHWTMVVKAAGRGNRLTAALRSTTFKDTRTGCARLPSARFLCSMRKQVAFASCECDLRKDYILFFLSPPRPVPISEGTKKFAGPSRDFHQRQVSILEFWIMRQRHK